MKKLFAILAVACVAVFLPADVVGQVQPGWIIESLTSEGRLDYNLQTGMAVGTNGVMVKYGSAVLTADSVAVNQDTGEVAANGKVRLQSADQLWAGDHIRYNFKTRQMQTEQFRTGRSPVFAGAQGLYGDLTNRVYSATNAFVTTDDRAVPFERVRASSITIVPGEYVEMRNATLYLGNVPVFYFPYYKRRLDGRLASEFNFVPGYRGRYGAFLLSSYTWMLNEQLEGTLHLDYRTKRGVGVGPDFNARLGRWGEASLSYYYTHDNDPGEDLLDNALPDNRQRLNFSYLATPWTNVTFRSQVRYQSDVDMNHDFFRSDYRNNPQPSTFVEGTKFWDNFGLSLYAQPRVNDFLDTIERLPEAKLTGWRQQLGNTPLYYESESSAGFYRHRFAETNGVPEPDYEAFRGDTYHQVLLPWTLFGWLNLTPRVGGRLTYYGETDGPGAQPNEQTRGVFNTGAEVSFKASRTWAGVTNGLLQLDGLRHTVGPSVNYVYVPHPSARPWELPQFDSLLPSLRLLPVEFPDFNAVDSVDAQNVLRLGLRNKLQTKRGGQVETFVDWTLFTDWRLEREDYQTTFSDICSDLVFRPQSWLTLGSEIRFDAEDNAWRLAFHTLTLQPNDVWSWSIGHYYLRDDYGDDPTAWGGGNDLINSTLFYRLNENWGARASHYYDLVDGQLREQAYTLYRDFRSWTGALSFQMQDERDGKTDYTIAFTFSLKASPKYRVGADAVRPYGLLGY